MHSIVDSCMCFYTSLLYQDDALIELPGQVGFFILETSFQCFPNNHHMPIRTCSGMLCSYSSESDTQGLSGETDHSKCISEMGTCSGQRQQGRGGALGLGSI